MRTKTLRYLNCWPSESSPYMSNARRICTEKAGVITTRRSNVDGESE
jgi:hypothetical protein